MPPVSSALAGLRGIPLDEMPSLPGLLGAALERVTPGAEHVVPVSAFQSAI